MTTKNGRRTVPVNGERLRTFRKNTVRTQELLADLSHVSRSFIAEIEAGKKQPSLRTAMALVRAMNDYMTPEGKPTVKVVGLDDLIS